MAAEVCLARLSDGASAAEQAQALERVLLATGFIGRLGKQDLVAIKLHVGERNNVTHVRPELAATAVKMLRAAAAEPFLTDTSTLYKSQRENAIKHILHAHRHGFGIEAVGAPFFPLDGLVGRHEREVEIGGELHQSVKVAGELFLADALLCLSHATGHMGAGMGAAIKNIGMGLSSRAGKMRQHSSTKPEVIEEVCQNCGKCRKWCPADAISEQDEVSFIDLEQCIGCGECLAVCRFNAVKFDWKKGATLQQSMAEHAAAVLRHFGPKAVFVNVLTSMTKDCDCMDRAQEKIMVDIGILASNDLVAADQATLDLTEQAAGRSLSELSFPELDPTLQIAHAEKMGLGSRSYRLVEV
jgi:uncharacterized protein